MPELWKLFTLPFHEGLVMRPTPSTPKKNQQKLRSVNRKYESLIVLNTKGNEESVDDLVSAVAKLHDASLTLEDNNPGLRVSLRLSGDRVQRRAA